MLLSLLLSLISMLVERLDDLLFIDIVCGVFAIIWCIEHFHTNKDSNNNINSYLGSVSYTHLTLPTNREV